MARWLSLNARAALPSSRRQSNQDYCSPAPQALADQPCRILQGTSFVQNDTRIVMTQSGRDLAMLVTEGIDCIHHCQWLHNRWAASFNIFHEFGCRSCF